MLKIDPDCPVTARRLRTLIESAVKCYSKLADRQRANFCQLGVDFDFICDCLSALGVTRRTISSPPLKFRGLSISNGFVIELEKAQKDLGLPLEISRKWIVHLTLETEKSEFFQSGLQYKKTDGLLLEAVVFKRKET
ncbi:hypothetical protein RRG08_041514 [Elysia crispata]|uniref:Uncharacterized protein n=1 Tax=Elysia crispata TaxID=231223 RepID=A0AAE1DJ04_9GAST|nr:hypothetical protein RRG08_041514 [Elysia crispata]